MLFVLSDLPRMAVSTNAPDLVKTSILSNSNSSVRGKEKTRVDASQKQDVYKFLLNVSQEERQMIPQVGHLNLTSKIPESLLEHTVKEDPRLAQHLWKIDITRNHDSISNS